MLIRNQPPEFSLGGLIVNVLPPPLLTVRVMLDVSVPKLTVKELSGNNIIKILIYLHLNTDSYNLVDAIVICKRVLRE